MKAVMLRSGVPLPSVFKLDVGWQFRSLVLSASQFQHILNDAGRTSEVFMRHSGHALSLLSGTRRGMILQDFCRKELARLHPHSKIEEPLRSTCCNGARRSALQAEYDFGMDARKVKCRSAQMSWNRAMMRWRVLFPKVKLPRSGFWDEAAFDDLYLTAQIACTSSSMTFRLESPQWASKQTAMVIRFPFKARGVKNVGKQHSIRS